jgi:hypothetical protein
MAICADVFAAFRASPFPLLVGLKKWIVCSKGGGPRHQKTVQLQSISVEVRSTVLGSLAKLVYHTIHRPL